MKNLLDLVQISLELAQLILDILRHPIWRDPAWDRVEQISGLGTIALAAINALLLLSRRRPGKAGHIGPLTVETGSAKILGTARVRVTGRR